MAAKVDELRRLMNEGYLVEEVRSDERQMEATLRRGPQVVVVRFGPHEAESLLTDRRPLR